MNVGSCDSSNVRLKRCVAAVLFGVGIVACGEDTDWSVRRAQLQPAEADEVVITGLGDAIWSRAVSGRDDEGLQSVFEVTRSADIAFQNLEQALSDEGSPRPGKSAPTRGPESIAAELAWAGVDVVSIANNHSMDYGIDGLNSTVDALDAAGVAHAGAGLNLAEALNPVILEENGQQFAFLAFEAAPRVFPPEDASAGIETAGVASIRGDTMRLDDETVVSVPFADHLKRMEEAVGAARQAADLVVVSFHFHWRDRDGIDAEGKQRIARAAVDAGAALVLGHGPTVLAGIEIYKGVPVLYSIGKSFHHIDAKSYEPPVRRFIEAMVDDERYPESLLVRAIVTRDARVRRLELLPMEIAETGDPRFTDGALADRILDRMDGLSLPFGTTIEREKWYGVLDLSGTERQQGR